MSRRFACLLVGTVVATAAAASAQPAQPDANRDEARQHFDRCVALMQNENFDAALVECQRSLDLFPTRSALFNEANCLKALHRYVEALRVIDRWIGEYAATAPAEEVDNVNATVEEMRGYVGWLWIETDVAGAVVVVDGQQVATLPMSAPTAIEIGTHIVQVTADGYDPAEQQITLASGEAARLSLNPSPRTVDVIPPDDTTTSDGGGVDQAWFWTTASTTVALGIAAGVTGGLMLDVQSDFEAGGSVDADLSARGADFQLATNVLIGVAGAAAAATILLAIFTDWGGDEPEDSEAAVVVAPTGVAVRW
jgi:hypothetical protein